MESAWNVLGVICPAIEGLNQLEIIAAIQLRLELDAVDRPDRLRPERCVPARLIHTNSMPHSSRSTRY